MDHRVRVSAQTEEITAFGDNRRRAITTGYDVDCDCGWSATYFNADEANAGAHEHLDWAQQGKPGLPARPLDAADVQRVVRRELEQQKKRMLETGDIFVDC